MTATASDTTHAIHCEHVRVEYAPQRIARRQRAKHDGRTRSEPVVAVRDVSLSIQPGERVCMLGPNGSGKSSLMRVLAGLSQQTNGSAAVFGFDPHDPQAAIRRGVAFQSVSLDDLLTVRENLMLFAASAGLGRDESRVQIEQLASRMVFADRLDQRVGTLSGGYARRVDLARAMLGNPSLLLLDEPTSGLDPTSRRMFFDAVDAAGTDADRPAVLLSTHLLDEAAWADRLIFMHNGTIASDSTLAKLHETYGNRVLRLTSQADGFDARVDAYLTEHGLSQHARLSSPRRMIVPVKSEGSETSHVNTLASMGIDVALGQMTLADVYEIVTGDALTGDAS
ncbi:MAG: ABC transporter ATP-binding protein [Phycisphaeraceae bacterium]|nr:ABC transporter ATP-binding protein [Phycisphaerales bacterium]MCB9860626.1 ABC transporter ATP-binding protein [Phycisphaeraceae bacterium]